MNEFELIQELTRSLPGNASVITGAGDDCAILDLGVPGRQVLFKTDAVVEGIHFLPNTAPELVGRKALARCLSDVAAMAGTPGSALVTLGLPRSYDPEFIKGIYAGLNALALQYQVAIVGGETTTNPEHLLISIALLGSVEKGKAVLRSGARVGDAIFVTGELGGSLAERHFSFEPRLAEARWLADHFTLHSMIDLSDGLAGDLRHILNASGGGAVLLAKTIPISRAAREQSRTGTHAKPALVAALTDGEDFELLFTLPSKLAVALVDAWKAQFPKIRLSCIGKVTAEPGLLLRDHNGVRTLNAHGYVHFT